MNFSPSTGTPDPAPASSTAPGPGPGNGSSFDRFTDAEAVQETLRERCAACVHDILSFVRAHLAAGPAPGPAHLSQVLFLARLCQSMGGLCPNLRQCILGQQGGGAGGDGVVAATPRQGRKLGRAKAAEVSPAQAKWACLKEELVGCSMEAYRIWSSAFSTVKN